MWWCADFCGIEMFASLSRVRKNKRKATQLYLKALPSHICERSDISCRYLKSAKTWSDVLDFSGSSDSLKSSGKIWLRNKAKGKPTQDKHSPVVPIKNLIRHRRGLKWNKRRWGCEIRILSCRWFLLFLLEEVGHAAKKWMLRKEGSELFVWHLRWSWTAGLKRLLQGFIA